MGNHNNHNKDSNHKDNNHTSVISNPPGYQQNMQSHSYYMHQGPNNNFIDRTQLSTSNHPNFQYHPYNDMMPRFVLGNQMNNNHSSIYPGLFTPDNISPANISGLFTHSDINPVNIPVSTEVNRITPGNFKYRDEIILPGFSFEYTEKSDFVTEKSCCICFYDYFPGMMMQMLPCNHIIHKLCLQDWFYKSQTCPICRSSSENIRQLANSV